MLTSVVTGRVTMLSCSVSPYSRQFSFIEVIDSMVDSAVWGISLGEDHLLWHFLVDKIQLGVNSYICTDICNSQEGLLRKTRFNSAMMGGTWGLAEDGTFPCGTDSTATLAAMEGDGVDKEVYLHFHPFHFREPVCKASTHMLELGYQNFFLGQVCIY